MAKIIRTCVVFLSLYLTEASNVFCRNEGNIYIYTIDDHVPDIRCSFVVLPFLYEDVPFSYDRFIKLTIFNSFIPDIVPFSFIEVTRLLILDLSSNGIKQISLGAFAGLHSLEQLNLSNNELTNTSHGIFNPLVDLQILDLSRNSIKYVDNNLCDSLLILSFLDLSMNRIQYLGPDFLSGTINVNFLNLSQNFLSVFDDKMLGQNVYFEQLNLSNNNISKLYLNGSANRIKSLDVSKNNLSEVYTCFPGVIAMNFSYNKINSLLLANCFLNMTIDSLNLSHNLLTANNIKNVSMLHSLRYLDLQDNNITFIPNDVFVQLKNLSYLDLSHNSLQSLDYGTFDHLDILLYLDLSHNRLTSLKRYLHSLSSLITLKINDNYLKNISSKQILKDIPYLRKISFNENDFSCNDLVEIVHDFEKKGIEISKGSATNQSNIHGIACNEYEISKNLDSKFKQEFVDYLKDVISSKLEKSQGNEFERGAMYNYFNNDFKNSNFYKYLESLKVVNSQNFNGPDILKYFNEDFEKSKFYKFLESLKVSENSTVEFNKNLYNYFNRDFNNSNLVQYLNQLEKSKTLLEDFGNSSMFTYFNNGFENSRFYRYLENLNSRLNSITPDKQNTYKNEYLFDAKNVETRSNAYYGILSVITVLLTVLVGFQFIKFYIHIKNKSIPSERIELVDNV